MRGYSRDHRRDCKQVCIALVVSREGLPLGYEVFDGNRNDATTVEEIVTAIEGKYGNASAIWVMDRGLASEENVSFLKAGGRRYILGTPKGRLRRHERDMVDGGWTQVREGLEVNLCTSPEGDETFILCRSDQRREKEKAMHVRFEARIAEGLAKIEASCRKCKHDPLAVERRIGRLLGQNSRAAGLFSRGGPTQRRGRRGSCLVKGGSMAAAGLGDEPRPVFDAISRIPMVDVILPTRSGIEIRKRCVARPTEHQAILLQRLGLHLPADTKLTTL